MSLQLTDIRGKWAFVTGASRGVGRQISLGLARQGCHVVLHSRTLSGTDSIAEEVRGQSVEVRQIEAELANAGDVERMLASLKADGPPIDILYNNAAIMTPYRSDWLSVPSEDFRATFEVNTTALIRICHALIPGMIDRRWGRIINVTSGIADQPELIAYAISKAAVDKFVTDTAARLKDHGILMNLLDPGWLRTDLGGPNAPGAVESVLPGALVPALLADGPSGQLFRAQDWAGREL